MPEWLNEPDNNGSTLPWVEQYVAEHGATGTPLMVLEATPRIKGLLIATCEWKGFIFKGSKLHDQLLEALQAYVKSGVKVHKMVIVATENGKMKVGLETEKKATCTWAFNDGRYAQSANDGGKQGVIKKAKEPNPFLPPSLAMPDEASPT